MTVEMSWSGRNDELREFADRTLFFIGGAPRSGTTWLQQMLDAHPDISCRGEGLFLRELAMPLEQLMEQRGRAVSVKNTQLFRHTGGFPLPAPADTEFLLGTAILLALRSQTEGVNYAAVGEKTPENAFFFPRLQALFPTGRFIGIARDPRDVLSSAWHFFPRPAGADETALKTAFVRMALPSMVDGARAMIAFGQSHPQVYASVTYEALLRDPASELARLFRFIGVSATPAIVAECLACTSFVKLSGGRPAGVVERGAFLRRGVAGEWRATFDDNVSAMILEALGWMFEVFGWEK